MRDELLFSGVMLFDLRTIEIDALFILKILALILRARTAEKRTSLLLF